MQANITTKIVEHGGEMKSEKTYRALADSLKRATKQLQSLERSLNRLIKQIDRINDDDYPVYATMRTSDGDNIIDKIYYDVLIAFLQVIGECLKAHQMIITMSTG